jgi:hypothetical protein
VSSYPRDELTRMLRDGARLTGHTSDQAAVHLISVLEVIGTPAFAAHVTVRPAGDPGTGGTVTVANVTKWARLLTDQQLDLSDSERSLVKLAAFHATGLYADLNDCLTGLDLPQVRTAAEAVLIITGADRFLHVTTKATVPPPPGYGGTL